jgi:cell division protein FtsI/penicillin-binding protein 2
VIGYTNSLYGQSGLEASLDAYLRGLQGNPSALLVWDQLAYSQPPPGLNIRLSLDLNLQKSADKALGDSSGGLVLMNAQNGEVLAMASHPGFDANQLDQQWSDLIRHPDSPLLNRATQGQYPPGTALGPFLLTATQSFAQLPDLPATTSITTTTGSSDCIIAPAEPLTWGKAVSAGCPAQQAALGNALGASRMTDLLRKLGFFTAPQVRLPAASQAAPATIANLEPFSLGQASLAVSPLQMALAAASLTQDGLRTAPRLALSVQTPLQGWVVLPPQEESTRVYTAGSVASTVETIRPSGQAYWSAVGTALNGDGKKVAWFVGGTLPSWQGTPLSIALALENGDAQAAQKAGAAVMAAAMR